MAAAVSLSVQTVSARPGSTPPSLCASLPPWVRVGRAVARDSAGLSEPDEDVSTIVQVVHILLSCKVSGGNKLSDHIM